MKRITIMIILCLLLIQLIPTGNSQCTAAEESDQAVSYGDMVETIESDTIWTGDRFVNGSLIIEKDLRLLECDLEIGGEGIRITENGSLTMEGSSIHPHFDGVGYFIESRGDVSIEDSIIDGCLDPANGYVGIYLQNGSFVMTDSSLERSGLIRSVVEEVNINDSMFPGYACMGGTSVITDSIIDGVGASITGAGHMIIRGSSITSNLSYSSSIAAISCEEANLTVSNININGSFGGGIYSTGSRVMIDDVNMEMNTSVYGIRAIECPGFSVRGASIMGSVNGIEMEGCNHPKELENISIDSGYSGIVSSGTGEVSIVSTQLKNLTYGLITSEKTRMENTSVTDSDVGIRLEKGQTISAKNCIISNYSTWGIEIESWNKRDLSGIEILPGPGSISSLALWGPVEINVVGPHGEEVSTDFLRISSSIGGETEVPSGEVDLVWGFVSENGDVSKVSYELDAAWGTARSSVSFNFSSPKTIDVHLPIADIWISDLEMEGQEAVVTLGTNNSDANGVVVTAYLDGSYRFDRRLNLVPGDPVEIRLPLGKVKEGDHVLECAVSSDDEYPSEKMAENNIMSVDVRHENQKDDVRSQLLMILILIVACVMILVTIMMRRRS